MENVARETAKVIEVIQKNNRVEQNKVSVVFEKKVVENLRIAGSIITIKQRGNVEIKESDSVEEIVELK